MEEWWKGLLIFLFSFRLSPDEILGETAVVVLLFYLPIHTVYQYIKKDELIRLQLKIDFANYHRIKCFCLLIMY